MFVNGNTAMDGLSGNAKVACTDTAAGATPSGVHRQTRTGLAMFFSS